MYMEFQLRIQHYVASHATHFFCSDNYVVLQTLHYDILCYHMSQTAAAASVEACDREEI